RLREVMRSSTNPTIAPYVKTAELQLRVTARAKTRQEGEMLIAPMLRQISAIFPDNVYGFDYQNIQTAVVQILAERHLTLATAESCTGGLVADRIVEIPGASGVLLCGIVAYANSVKEQILGVTRHTLDEQGAVSRACALEMARGVRKISGADIGVSTTGIAGPAGGTMEKPVGLVFVAVVSEHGEEVRELHLARGRDDDRETIRSTAASYALDMVIRMTKEMSC
ncbi:MAG: nicotinamide-nucleotide amidohydrolase family protein, partial [Oscillospiraceae bacterium]